MRAPGICSALVTVAVACLVTGGCATSVAPVAASTPAGASPGSHTYSANGDMWAVAATSPTDAWAVGDLFAGAKSLIVHWNGSRWSDVPAAIPSHTTMRAVAASSPSDAWAVGETYRLGSTWQAPLTLHWDGRSWKRVALPVPAGTYLSSVSVTSPANAWAVGGYSTSAPATASNEAPIVLHWDGAAWRRVPLPGLPPPGGGASLSGVSATSATDAWAVGGYSNADPAGALILHWDGSSWSQVPSVPANVGGPFVAATATGDTWLVGTVAGRWNGHAWATTPVPLVTNHLGNRGGNVSAFAVAGHAAWVAGNYCAPIAACETMLAPLLLRWTGSGWQRTPVPASDTRDISIFGVAVTSPTDAWAVGTKQPRTTIILHWNGSVWS